MSANLDQGRGLPTYRLAPDTPEAIRRDLDGLLSRPPRGPQTALSDGFGPALADFIDAVDIASLAHARRRHLRRQAMDAVDHLIALLDALDVETEDREPDCDSEPDDPAEDDGTAEPSLGAPERSPWVPDRQEWRRHFRASDASQARWAAGASSDREEEHDGREPDDDAEEDDPGEDNGDLDDDGLSRGEGDSADDEPTLGAPAGDGDQELWAQGPSTANDPESDDADRETTAPERHSRGFVRCGPEDDEDDDPGELDFRSHLPAQIGRSAVSAWGQP